MPPRSVSLYVIFHIWRLGNPYLRTREAKQAFVEEYELAPFGQRPLPAAGITIFVRRATIPALT